MILQFQTPWPKRSYQHVDDVSKQYNRKFSSLARSFSIIVLFFLSGLLSVPISVQDIIIQSFSTVVMGYTILFHLQLYEIFPVLVVVPLLFIGLIVHFYLQAKRSQKKKAQVQFQKEVNEMKEKEQEQEKFSTNRVSLNIQKTSALKPGKLLRNLSQIIKQDSDDGMDDEKRNPSNLLKDSISAPLHKPRRDSIQEGIKLASKMAQSLGLETNLDDSESFSFSSMSELSSEAKETSTGNVEKITDVPVLSDEDDDDNDFDNLYNLHLPLSPKRENASEPSEMKLESCNDSLKNVYEDIPLFEMNNSDTEDFMLIEKSSHDDFSQLQTPSRKEFSGSDHSSNSYVLETTGIEHGEKSQIDQIEHDSTSSKKYSSDDENHNSDLSVDLSDSDQSSL
jgi:hypothetical protein